MRRLVTGFLKAHGEEELSRESGGGGSLPHVIGTGVGMWWAGQARRLDSPDANRGPPRSTPSTVMLKSFPFALPGGASEQPGSPLPNPSLAVPQC